MSGRFVMLLVATVAAGGLAWWAWERDVDRDPPVLVPARTLAVADLDLFEKGCGQLATDRAAARIEVAPGQRLLAFVAQMTQRPARLRPTCERAGVPLLDFLAITTALAQAQRLDADWQRFEREADARAAAAEALAEAHAQQGLTSDGDSAAAPPTEPAGLKAADRANVAFWREHAARVEAAWTAVVGTPTPAAPPR